MRIGVPDNRRPTRVDFSVHWRDLTRSQSPAPKGTKEVAVQEFPPNVESTAESIGESIGNRRHSMLP
ncbi:hypothetical protein A5682_11620 [Mycobacterium mantenii]|uniref:hypothetical protein n=1 Tax=Mycobacterium mantenii TaxID=560555 RepID=UPI000801B6FD|nr:hypothetical protein [Mycobacterium mantenii]OBH47527.1 hypothetical protein A5687_16755 [Mycobacterium mantenii]OBH68830.1 hypothetical protein A5682_11620 [Mycobacterium mantenii]